MKKVKPYDLNNPGIGYNRRSSECGLEKRNLSYEPIGFVKICKCNLKIIK